MTPCSAQEFLGLSLGYLDVFDHDEALDIRLEYRSARSVVFENLHPFAGLELTSDASLWGGGGLLYDIDLGSGWHLIPSLAAGFYAQGSSNMDLDFPLQFRPQIELAYEMKSGNRAALAFSHLSNASMGDSNPGTEIIGLYWHQNLEGGD